MNGKFCKDPRSVTSKDFVCSGAELQVNNGSDVTRYFIDPCPALNTMGVSVTIGRLSGNGIIPPHYHPRASELLICKTGKIFAGFKTSTANGNKFFGNVLEAGQAMAIPQGMIHFLFNLLNNKPALSLSAFSSQNPGLFILDSNTSSINIEILAKTFSLDQEMVDVIQKSLVET